MRPCYRSVPANLRKSVVLDQQFKRVPNRGLVRLSNELSVDLPPPPTGSRAPPAGSDFVRGSARTFTRPMRDPPGVQRCRTLSRRSAHGQLELVTCAPRTVCGVSSTTGSLRTPARSIG